MAEHPIKDLMTTAMENLKDMIDVNTIVGDPVETPDGGIVLTVSKVGFGFAAGGSEFTGGGSDSGSSLPFGGGSGGGVSITPVAFLVINKEGVQMLHLQQKPMLMERLLELAPMAAEKIQQMMNSSGQGSQQQSKSGSGGGSSEQSGGKGKEEDSKESEGKDKKAELDFDI